MLDFKRFDGPYGIPVFHQRMPRMVRGISLGYVVFTGASSDGDVGLDGLHHWFEHVPFRGTKKYPGGYDEIEGTVSDKNGNINAWTSMEATCYHATVHESQWKKGLDVITDMVATPLITTESVEAERKVIHQEIAGRKGSLSGKMSQEMNAILYPGHAFGHSVLGTEETLATMGAETLRKAHKLGYDRSRIAFFCTGNMSSEELLSALRRQASRIPDRGLPEQRTPEYFGPLPPIKQSHTAIETEFPTSAIMTIFPLEQNDGSAEEMLAQSRTLGVLDAIFQFGGLASPLMRILRGDRQLVYSAWMERETCSGGGYYGFHANAKRENIPAILDAFRDVLEDPQIVSAEHLRKIKSCVAAEVEMMPIDSESFFHKGIWGYIKCGGRLENYRDTLKWIQSVSIKDIKEALKMFRIDKAYTIIYEGMG